MVEWLGRAHPGKNDYFQNGGGLNLKSIGQDERLYKFGLNKPEFILHNISKMCAYIGVIPYESFML